VIDIKWLTSDNNDGKKNSDLYKENIINRGGDPQEVDAVLKLNQQRKEAILAFDSKKAEQNAASKEFGQAKKKGDDTSALLERMQNLSKEVKDLEKISQDSQEKMNFELSCLPNMTAVDVPVGKSEDDNKVISTYGEKPNFDFKAKEHWELGESTNTIDFERAGKVAGARFAFLRGAGARLERALIQFMLDIHTQKHGYEEMIPPLIVQSNALYGTSNFPKFKEDVFKIEGRDGYLIPTAEVPVTNFVAGEILKEEELPLKFAAYTPCFRSEAGSYGRDTKGLIRQHQFNKVELVKVTRPENSEKEHDALLHNAEKILQDLGLHFQTVSLCTGDISFGAKKCYDINVWLPGQQAYREISSCSNFGDFQARRANIRFKPSGDKAKPVYAHTINGSGLAVGRTLIAIYENYQNEDGSISVPDVLVSYMGGITKIS